MSEVILAKSAGFCFGVERAVDMVYEQIKKGGNIYTYGPIIHNESVVEDLAAKGVKIIESKEEILKDKEKQMKDQKDQIRVWEERVRQLEDRLQSMESGPNSPTKENVPAAGREDKKGADPLDRAVSSADDLLLSFYTPEKASIYIPRPARSLFQRRKDREAERFIRQFMEAGDYSEEQKEFLIRCLEQGDSLDFIREFASPSLSVEHMAWLRKIIGRRLRYGR